MYYEMKWTNLIIYCKTHNVVNCIYISVKSEWDFWSDQEGCFVEPLAKKDHAKVKLNRGWWTAWPSFLLSSSQAHFKRIIIVVVLQSHIRVIYVFVYMHTCICINAYMYKVTELSEHLCTHLQPVHLCWAIMKT